MNTPTNLTGMERRWLADLLGGQQIVVSVADVKAGALGRLVRLGVVRKEPPPLLENDSAHQRYGLSNRQMAETLLAKDGGGS